MRWTGQGTPSGFTHLSRVGRETLTPKGKAKQQSDAHFKAHRTEERRRRKTIACQRGKPGQPEAQVEDEADTQGEGLAAWLDNGAGLDEAHSHDHKGRGLKLVEQARLARQIDAIARIEGPGKEQDGEG
ncbi:hypothetical protein D3C87_1786920 [compost metagenome]